jgi:hypothetical protein
MTMSEALDTERVRALERLEIAAKVDFMRAVPAGLGAELGVAVHDVGGAAVMIAGRTGVLALNRVLGLGLDAPATAAQLDEIVAIFRAAGVPRFLVQLSPTARPAALPRMLAERGFVHVDNLVRSERAADVPAAAATTLDVRRIGPDEGEVYARVLGEVFGWPAAMIPWGAACVGRPGWRHYLAFDGDAPVATAALFVDGSYGWLGNDGTTAAARGRGAQSALIARRLRDAAADGCRLLAVETSEERPGHPSPSWRNYRRLGFEDVYLRPNYLCAF